MDRWNRITKLRDGVLQEIAPGEATQTWVRAFVAQRYTAHIVTVAQDLSAMPSYNEYPTIAQGIAGAVARQAGDPTFKVAVIVEPGSYNEFALVVPSGVVVMFKPGAVLVPSKTGGFVSTDYDLTLTGDAGIFGVEIIRGDTADEGGGTLLRLAVDFSGFAYYTTLSHGAFGSYRQLQIDAKSAGLDPAWYGIRLRNLRLMGAGMSSQAHVGIVGAINFTRVEFEECEFFAGGSPSPYWLSIEGGASTTYPTVIMRGCSFAKTPAVTPVSPVKDFYLGAFAAVQLINCSGLALGSSRVDVVGGGTWKERVFMEAPTNQTQTWVKPDTDQVATVDEGFQILQGTRLTVDEIASNLALLASQVNVLNAYQSEPYDGMVVWDFADAADISPTVGHNVGVRHNAVTGAVDINGDWAIDDFESYADTPALQAAWTMTPSFAAVSLVATGGSDGGKFMRLTQSAGSSSAYIQKTITVPADSHLSGFFYLNLKWKISGNWGTFPAASPQWRPVLVDGSGNKLEGSYFQMWPAALPPTTNWGGANQWRGFCTRNNVNFDWNAPVRLRLEFTGMALPFTGVIDIDEITIEQDEPWKRDAVITSFEGAGADGWSGTQINADLTYGFDGNSYVETLVPGVGFGWTEITGKTLGVGSYFAQIKDDSVALRLMVKMKGWTAGQEAFTKCNLMMQLKDTGGNYVQIYGQEVGSEVPSQSCVPSDFPGNLTGKYWKPVVFLLSEANRLPGLGGIPKHWTDPPEAFDFQTVNEIKIYHTPTTVNPFTLGVDLLEVGWPGMLTTSQVTVAKTVDQAMVHVPASGLSQQYAVDLSLGIGATNTFKRSFYVAQTAFIGIWNWNAVRRLYHGLPAPAGEYDGFQGSWLKIVKASPLYMRVRVLAKKRLSVGGISVLYRDVP